MKIVFFITGLNMGGAECQVCDLSDELSALGHDITIICLSGKVIKKPKLNTIRIVQLGLKKNFINFFSVYMYASRLIKKINPDVIHSHMYHANIFSRLLRLTTFFPLLICSMHNKGENRKTRMLAYRLTDKLATISTNVSQEAVNCYVSCKASRTNKIKAFYNGINIDSFIFNEDHRKEKRLELSLNDESKLFLSVGRLTKQKDYPSLLNAFSQINSLSPTYLAIIGVGELDSELKLLADELKISDRVYWLGLRNDVNKWMSACDAFVLSSKSEGFALVVAEAMACQRAIIATDCGGVKEVLGDTGRLVSPQNSKLLSEAMNQVISLPDYDRGLMGRYARQRVEDLYSIKNITNKWLDFYSSLIH